MRLANTFAVLTITIILIKKKSIAITVVQRARYLFALPVFFWLKLYRS